MLAHPPLSAVTTFHHDWRHSGGYPDVNYQYGIIKGINESVQANTTGEEIDIESGSKMQTMTDTVSGDNRTPAPPWTFPFSPYQPSGTIQHLASWPVAYETIPDHHEYSAQAIWDRTYGSEKYFDVNHPENEFYERTANRHTWNYLAEGIIDLTEPGGGPG